MLTYKGFPGIWQRDKGPSRVFINSKNNKHVHRQKACFTHPCCKYGKEVNKVEDFANTLDLNIVWIIKQILLEDLSTANPSGKLKTKGEGASWDTSQVFMGVHAARNVSCAKFYNG